MDATIAPPDPRRPKDGADVFISYSRADRPAVVTLADGLADRDKTPWVDLEDIPPSAEWMSEINRAIDAADGYLVVISPDFARSTVCAEEFAHAKASGKRIVPFLVRPTDPQSVPAELAALNWIDATHDPNDAALDAVISALDTDLDHVRDHTKLLVRASDWEHRSEDRGLLLRGSALAEAETLVAQIDREPHATELQARYVLASRRASGRRQRAAIALVTAMLLVAAGLSAVAWTQRSASIRHQHVAEQRAAESRSREIASAAVDQLQSDPELSLLLATDATRTAATPEAVAALRTSLAQSQVRTALSAHQGPVSDVTYSPNGDRLLTGSYDGTARVWDLTIDPATSVVLEGHTDLIERAVFDASADRVVTASFDGTARVWDARDGTQLALLDPGVEGAMHDATFSPDGTTILTAGNDGVARVWNATTGRIVQGLPTHRPLYVSRFSPDGTTILTAGDDGVARLWDTGSGQMRYALGGPGPGLLAAAFDPLGAQVATAARDGVVRIWDAGSGRLTARLEGHEGPAVSVVFSPDGREVVTAGSDGTARLWHAPTGAAVQTLRGHKSELGGGSFSDDGHYILTWSEDGTTRVWDARTGTQLSVLSGHGGAVLDATFAPDGQTVASGSVDGTARIWEALSGRTVLDGDISWLSPPMAGRFAVSTFDGTLYVCDVLTGRVIRSIDAGQPLTSAAISGDGTLATAASFDGDAWVWEAESGRLLARLRGHHGAAASDFYGSSERVLTWADDGTARLWVARTGTRLMTYTHDTDPTSKGIWLAILSPDGREVFTTGLRDQRVMMWDAATGTPLWSADQLGGVDPIFAWFSPDGRRVATVGGTAQVWNARTGTSEATLTDPDKIDAGAFAPNGASVITGSNDGGIREWDPQGILLRETLAPGGTQRSVAFSPDGRWYVTTAEDGVARVWDASTAASVAAFGGGSGSGLYSYFADPTHLVTATEGSVRVDRCDACGSVQELLALSSQRATRSLNDAELTEFLGAPARRVERRQAPGLLEDDKGQAIPAGSQSVGTYRVHSGDLVASFRLEEGWVANGVTRQEQEGEKSLGGVVQLLRSSDPSVGLAFIVAAPGRVIDGSLDWNDRRNVRPFPDDLPAWLSSHPRLRTSNGHRVTVGGVQGESIDTLVTSVPRESWPNCGGGCVPLLALSLVHQTGPATDHDGLNVLAPGEVDRWIVLKHEGTTLIINAWAGSPDAFRAFMRVATPVLDSLQLSD